MSLILPFPTVFLVKGRGLLGGHVSRRGFPPKRVVYLASTLDSLHALHRCHPTCLIAMPSWTAPYHMQYISVPRDVLCVQGSFLYLSRALDLLQNGACSKLLLDECLIRFTPEKEVDGHEWVVPKG